MQGNFKKRYKEWKYILISKKENNFVTKRGLKRSGGGLGQKSKCNKRSCRTFVEKER